MLLSNWLNGRFRRRSHPSRRRHRVRETLAEVETLEDRCLLATFLVNTLDDETFGGGNVSAETDDGNGLSLREAIGLANDSSNPGEDNIRFDPALLNTSRVITLTNGQLEILESISIRGPSFDPAGIIVDGNQSSRVFDVESTAESVTLQFFTITGGSTSGDGGGLLNQGNNTLLADMVVSSNQASFGGGISNASGGMLEIQRSRIVNNSASSDGGGIDNFTNATLTVRESTIAQNVADSGGGLVNESGATQMRILNSTISHNTASSGTGGGIANFSTTNLDDDSIMALLVQNSTIVGNLSTGGGGGVSATAGDVMTINLTIANNFDTSTNSTSGAGGISRTGGGTVTGVNVIVSQNNSNSGNNNTNPGALNGAGTQANFIGGNPRLGPLQDNGGPTFTMLPLRGSPVLEGGVTDGTTQLDQRGFARNVSSSGNGSPSVDQGAVEFFPTLTQPYVVGPGVNSGGPVKSVFDAATDKVAAGQARFKTESYPGFRGEIRVALADLNGDGTQDIISGAGPGGGPHIIIRNGIDPTNILDSFFAFEGNFFGGIFVAAGDIDGDGTPDIIASQGSGGSTVRVFDGNDPGNLLVELNPFPGFNGGARVASGDINGDGRADLIAAAGPGGGPHVVTFDGSTVIADPSFDSLINGPSGSFFAYNGLFRGGVFVGAGDVNGDGVDDIVTGAGAGGGPHVQAFSNSSSSPIASFFAYSALFAGGVRVGAVDFDGDQFDDIVTGAGPGGGPHVRILSGRILTNFNTANDLQSFFPFDVSFSGGVYVAGSDALPSGGSPLRIAEDVEPAEGPVPEISAGDVTAITSAAVDRFESAGAGAAELDRLQIVSFEIADLGGDLLALTFGNRITIDAGAAGIGFFVDPTPNDDIEFQTATGQALAAEAQNRVDLLTVVVHEFAHVLGYADLDHQDHPDHLLADRLAPGIRRFLREDDLAALDSAFQRESLDALLN